MDPDVLLDNLRSAVKAFISAVEDESYTNEHVVYIAEDVAYLFDNLDTWLTSGGFTPAAWAGREPRHFATA